MEDSSYNAYNSVMNMLKRCANQLYQAQFMFQNNDYYGFAKMAEYETMERWRYTDRIADYLLHAGRMPILDAMPKPTPDFPSPKEALQLEMNTLANIVATLKQGIAQAAQNDQPEMRMMSKLYKKVLKEHEEIKGIINRMNMGANMLQVDNYLYAEYAPKIEYHDKKRKGYYMKYYKHNPCEKY
jgi:ferritin